MTQHVCPRCGYSTYQKQSIRSHYHRKIPCHPVLECTPITELIHNLDNPLNAKFSCNTCNKKFTTNQGYANHIRNAHVALSEHGSDSRDNESSDANDPDKHTIQRLQKELEELKKIVSRQGNTTNNTTNNNNINIINVVSPKPVNNFGSEKIDHITKDDLRQYILKTYDGVKDLITNIHLNPDIPENHNIRFKSAKQKTLSIIQEGKCVEVNQVTALDKMIHNGCKLMYPEFQDLMVNDTYVRERAQHIAEWFNTILSKNIPPYFNLRRDILALLKQNDSDIASTWKSANLLASTQKTCTIAGS